MSLLFLLQNQLKFINKLNILIIDLEILLIFEIIESFFDIIKI